MLENKNNLVQEVNKTHITIDYVARELDVWVEGVSKEYIQKYLSDPQPYHQYKVKANKVKKDFAQFLWYDWCEISNICYHKNNIGNNNRWEVFNEMNEHIGYLKITEGVYGREVYISILDLNEKVVGNQYSFNDYWFAKNNQVIRRG